MASEVHFWFAFWIYRPSGLKGKLHDPTSVLQHFFNCSTSTLILQAFKHFPFASQRRKPKVGHCRCVPDCQKTLFFFFCKRMQQTVKRLYFSFMSFKCNFPVFRPKEVKKSSTKAALLFDFGCVIRRTAGLPYRFPKGNSVRQPLAGHIAPGSGVYPHDP